MAQDELERDSTDDWDAGPPSPFRILPFWGVVLIGALLLYTAQDVFSNGGVANSAASRQAVARSTYRPPPVSYTAVPGGYRPEPELFIYMVCDGETARAIYSGNVRQQVALLTPANDRELMADLLAGRPTPLPELSRTFYSACMRQAIDEGRFP